MNPTKFKENNVVYVAPNCGDLPAYQAAGEIISCWKGTWKERLLFLLHGKMWLSVAGNVHPPVYLSVKTLSGKARGENGN